MQYLDQKSDKIYIFSSSKYQCKETLENIVIYIDVYISHKKGTTSWGKSNKYDF